MNSKQIVENIFKTNGIKWEIKDYNNYLDPKCKTSASIYSKLIRLYSNANNKTEYTILNSGIKDLLRMTIIIEYSEVISTIKKLRQSFPDLSGYINYKNSGYRGVHLNLKIDGIPCEIQLSPKIIVMGVDYLHTLHEKWRDFDSSSEMKFLIQREQEILNNNIQNKNNLLKSLNEEKNILKNKILEEQKDLELRNKTYNDIFNAANFPLYEEEITKAIYELNQIQEESLPLTNPTLINIFNKNLLSKGDIDKNKVKAVSDQLPQNIQLSQDKLINLVKNCLGL